MKRNWYAVYTKANQEKRVAALLSKKKIENFLPLNHIVINQGNRSRIEFEPLIACFVFVYITEAEIDFIKRLNFVTNFVYWLGSLAIIKDNEIENVRHFVNRYANIKLEKIKVSFSGSVRIMSAGKNFAEENFMNIENSFIQLKVPSLGYILISEIAEENTDALVFSSENNLI